MQHRDITCYCQCKHMCIVVTSKADSQSDKNFNGMKTGWKGSEKSTSSNGGIIFSPLLYKELLCGEKASEMVFP